MGTVFLWLCNSEWSTSSFSFWKWQPNSLLKVQMVSSLRSGRNVTFRILDVDWSTSDKVILASDDGCIRILEMSMKSSCFRMDEQELTGMELQWKEALQPVFALHRVLALFWGQSCFCSCQSCFLRIWVLRKYVNRLECFYHGDAGLCNGRCQSLSSSGL